MLQLRLRIWLDGRARLEPCDAGQVMGSPLLGERGIAGERERDPRIDIHGANRIAESFRHHADDGVVVRIEAEAGRPTIFGSPLNRRCHAVIA